MDREKRTKFYAELKKRQTQTDVKINPSTKLFGGVSELSINRPRVNFLVPNMVPHLCQVEKLPVTSKEWTCSGNDTKEHGYDNRVPF